jgi:hypothetical protein
MSKEFQDELLKKLPTEPPEGLLRWWNETYHSELANAIVYRAAHIIHPATGLKEKMVECKCTYCGETYYLDYVPAAGCSHSYTPAPFGFMTIQGENIISGNSVCCQECGAPCRALHIGNIGSGREIYEEYPLSLGRVDDIPVCFVWRLIKTVYKDGTTVTSVKPYEAYAFSGKKCYKFVGYFRYFSTSVQLSHWECRCRCDDTSCHWPKKKIFPWKAGLWDGTCLENCKVKRFVRDSADGKMFLVSYLRTFQKHPNIENLVTAGMSRYINSLIPCSGGGYYNTTIITEGINFKERKPSKMIGLTRTELRTAAGEKWTFDEIEAYKLAKDSKYPLKLDEFRAVYKYFTGRSLNDLVKNNVDAGKVYRYLIRQNSKYVGMGASLYHLKDYWEMMRSLKLPLETEKDFYPQNIVKAHNRCVELVNERKEEDFFIKESKEREIFSELAEKYESFSFNDEDFLISIAPQPVSLRQEGRALDHCVGNYVKRHAEGRHLIFFLRRASDPTIPFYTVTLDVKELRISMNLGHHNCPTTPEVEAFSKKWLEYIKEVRRKQDEQGSKHNRSRECA